MVSEPMVELIKKLPEAMGEGWRLRIREGTWSMSLGTFYLVKDDQVELFLDNEAWNKPDRLRINISPYLAKEGKPYHFFHMML